MKRCNEESKLKCKSIINSDQQCDIKCVRTPILEIKKRACDKNINALIRERDAKEKELELAKEKTKEHK